MRRAVTVTLQDPPPNGALVIAPVPLDHWGQRLDRIEVENAGDRTNLAGLNTRCAAMALAPSGQEPVRIRYNIELTDTSAPDWVWARQDNALTLPSEDLACGARAVTAGAATEREALRRLVSDAAERFSYGHVENRFNDGSDTVPLVCGLARGSCVDINTYLLAGARAVGLKGQYIAGYWFHPEKTQTGDMHCWLAFEPDGVLEFWDVAHGLKWSDTLGAQVEEGLNPAGGRRVAMSCGRGLQFETRLGPVEISHFSEPFWLLPDGEMIRPSLHVTVDDPEGLPQSEARRQSPRQLSGTSS